MDLQSGRFTPVAGGPVVPEVTAAQVTSGVIELTVTITIASDFPRDTVISCGMNVDVTSLNLVDGALGKWLETASGVAKVHGSSATCTLLIPYSWVLPTPTQAETLTATGRFSVTAVDQTNKAVLRSTDQPFFSTTRVPPNDTTSKFYVSATI